MHLCGASSDIELFTQVLNYVYIMVLSSLFIFLIWKLCQSLQMFPIKEKCGKLILLQLVTSYIYLITYPVLLAVNIGYYNDNYQSYISGLNRCIYNTYSIIYLMRCLRISYAQHLNLEMVGLYYQIIKKETICCLITIMIALVTYFIPEILLKYNDYIFIEDNSQTRKKISDSLLYQFTFKESNFVFNSVALFLSLYLIRAGVQYFSIQSTFQIKTEIVLAILLEISFLALKNYDACEFSKPIYYIGYCCKLYIMLIITVVIPLIQVFYNQSLKVKKQAEHFPYVIVADNFELFLSEPICVDLFYEFMVFYDRQNHEIYNQSITNANLLSPYALNKLKGSQDQDYEISLVDQYDIVTQTLFNKNPPSKTVTLSQDDESSPSHQKLQTVQCFILWLDLTLIFSKYNSLNQHQPIENMQLLTQEIIQYMTDLLNRVDLQTFMPAKLAQQVLMFNQCFILSQFGEIRGESLCKSQIQYNHVNQNLVWSKIAQRNSLRQIFSKHVSETSQFQYIFKDVIEELQKKSAMINEDEDEDVRPEEIPYYKDINEVQYDPNKIYSQIEDSKLNISNLEMAYEIRYLMFEIISLIFEQYKKTVSYHTLHEQFKINEMIQFRLYKMDLTAEFK